MSLYSFACFLKKYNPTMNKMDNAAIPTLALPVNCVARPIIVVPKKEAPLPQIS